MLNAAVSSSAFCHRGYDDGVVQPLHIGIVDRAQPQAREPVFTHQVLEPRRVCRIVWRVQTVADEQAHSREPVRVSVYAVCRVTVVATVVADVADDGLVDAEGGHAGDQVFGRLVDRRHVFRAGGDAGVKRESGVVDHPGVCGSVDDWRL